MITVNLNKMPIVEMHFGNKPNDKDVKIWLNKCQSIINQELKFVVVSTFDESYQFSQKGRKLQNEFYKSVFNDLKKYCLAMLRVTEAPKIIKKVEAPSLKKNYHSNVLL